MPRKSELTRLLSLPTRTPALSAYTTRERQLITTLKTPRQVQRYLRALPYNWEATLRTFRGSVEAGRAQCLEAVFVAAAVLEHHGYPPTVVDIESTDGLDHVIYLFQRGGRWGSIGRSRDYGLHGRAPAYASVATLVRSYMDPYVDGSGRINAYGVAHLDALSPADWRLSTRSVWREEQALIDMPHTDLPTGERRYARALRRDTAFKASGAPTNRRTMQRLYGDQVRHWW
jgi:hypothetical protein